MLQNPLGTALVLLTGYYAMVGAVQKIRARRGGEAWVGAVLFGGLAATAALWPVVGTAV